MSGGENATAMGIPPIATRMELEQRIEQRPTPAPEMHLTPDGSTTQAVNQSVNRANEVRIGQLQEKLEQSRERLESGFAIAQVRGRARGDFERGR